MRFVLLFTVFAMAFLSGCVPNRKIVFLQNDDLKNRENIPADTVLRTHQMVINEYKIQPLDMLSINFETLSDETDAFDFLSKLSSQGSGGGTQANSIALNGIFVDTQGEIEYPVLGKIKVVGLSIFQAEQIIRKRAVAYIPDVVVRVRMLNFRFTILGEVNSESVLTSTNPRLTLMEAIGLAGGLSDLADRSLIKIVRQRDDSSEVYYANLLNEDFIESPHYYVQQNDLIIVPPLKQRPFRKYFSSNLGIVASVVSFGLLIITLSR